MNSRSGNTDSGDGAKALKKRVAIGCRQWKEIVEGYSIMEWDVKETRKKLIALQDIVSLFVKFVNQNNNHKVDTEGVLL